MNCIAMRNYLNTRRTGKSDVVGVRYEDVVGNPHESIKRILEYCRLPVDLVEAGVRGLEVDSQKDSMFAISVVGSLSVSELTPESITRANEILKSNGLSLIGEECILDGTITCHK